MDGAADAWLDCELAGDGEHTKLRWYAHAMEDRGLPQGSKVRLLILPH